MPRAITVFIKEITDSLRDRRTIVTALLMPIVLMPAVMIGSFKLQEFQIKQQQEKKAIVAIDERGASSAFAEFLATQDTLEIKKITGDGKSAITDGQAQVYLALPDDVDKKIAENQSFHFDILHKSSDINSASALSKIQAAIFLFNNSYAAGVLQQNNIATDVLSIAQGKPSDIASAEEVGGYFAGLLLPMFIVLFAIIGGMYIAIDVSAGEKERKTLEALLFTPASRSAIVFGKYLAVASTAAVTIVLSLASLYTAFKFFPPQFGDQSFVLNLTLPALLLMLMIGIILSVMFAGLLLSVAIFAKSYKEAQNYITPFYLVAVLPVAILGQLPGFKPTLPIFLIPGVNAVFVMKEVLIGVYDPWHIIITLASLCVFSIIAIVVASKLYAKESVLFRS